MPLRLYNTLVRAAEEFRPSDGSRITFYSCGPTVYDDAHIGNFRSFLAADLLRRWVESPMCELTDLEGRAAPQDRRVVHVMNITDVGHMTDDDQADGAGEDKMAVAGRRIAEAKKAGKLPPGTEINPADPYAIASFYAGRFKEDARKLGLKLVGEADGDPSLMPLATKSIAGMIEVIAALVRRGHAYVVGEPGSRVVYFRVLSFRPYGRLSGNTLDALKEGEGGRVSAQNQSQKEHSADFLLWKEDPRHLMRWDSPWGPGYPGWHVECTAMSITRLLGPERFAHYLRTGMASGSLIDLHSGGEDNIFPHHECEIAQSCCAFTENPDRGSFARLWFHPRFLLVEGTKMSKSKGNFFTPRDLFARGVEPAALRLELIKTHYRSNANFTEQGLRDSQRTIERWRRFVDEAERAAPAAPDNPDARARATSAFVQSMNDDLNIAGALAAINSWMNEVPTPTRADGDTMRRFDRVLGLLELERPAAVTSEIGVWAPGLSPDAGVEAKLRERRDARAAKDFKRSDQIRDELAAMGYAIKDMAGGKVEVRRL